MRPIEKINDDSVTGNKQVCEFLEKWLEKAKQGKINFAGIILAESPVTLMYSHCGVRDSYFAGYFAAHSLAESIQNYIDSGKDLDFGASTPANQVVFDITNQTVSFDAIAWLIWAEMERQKAGVNEPLEIAFVARKPNSVLPHQQNGHFENIVIPAMRMVGAKAGENYEGRQYNVCSMLEITNAALEGRPIPKLKPIEYDFGFPYKDFVTITLREAPYFTHRNSNLEAWFEFGRYLKDQGENVIIVQDTAKADQLLNEFDTCPKASKDLNIRLALYEQAKCNLFVSNGPWMLALFGTKPWLMLNHTDPMDPFVPNTPSWWKRNHGIVPGEQFPWCTDKQKIVWKTDTYENILNAWKELNV